MEIKKQTQKQKPKRKTNKAIIGIIFLNAVNVILIILLILILKKLPVIAKEVKDLKNKYVLAHEKIDQAVLRSDLLVYNEKISSIESHFADEESILNFIIEIDKLKSAGLVADFSFVSEEPVKDKTGSFGFPILIVSEGSIQNVNSALAKIDSLPYLKRAVDVKLIINEDKTVKLEYGGFIYVSKNIISD